uniref:Protein RIC-3-like n=1 Tax=Strongyloides papillosus TaxID=174720 RepID=A0A0N5BNH4_STREA
MGLSDSKPQMPDPMMMDQHPYPDLNLILRGVPKMIQVADDMHRMTNYIKDLRDMLLISVFISFIGIMLFLICKIVGNRKRRRNRKRTMVQQYEQSSLGRRYLPYEPQSWERIHKFGDHEKNQITRSGTPQDFGHTSNSTHNNNILSSTTTTSTNCTEKSQMPLMGNQHVTNVPLLKKCEPVNLLYDKLRHIDSSSDSNKSLTPEN